MREARMDLSAGIELMPSTAEEEVMQNVRMAVGIWRGSVPLDREFGLDGTLIDAPSNAMRGLLMTKVARAVEECEPRAKLLSMGYEGEEEGRAVLTIGIEER